MKSIYTLILLVLSQLTFSQSSFNFHGTTIKQGTKQHFKIPISNGKNATFIPITVFCGAQKGPTLGITAGVHGYEYPPILAGQQLIKSINPKTLKGVVILVQIANLESFIGRSPYVNPKDGKNLNRIFPGNKNGSITEKIADFITKNVIAKSDYFLDMHAGDAPEDLMPYAAYYSNSKMPKVSNIGKNMAKALGFDYIIVFETDGKDYLKKEHPSLYCSAEAFKRGIPAVDIECGRLGLSEKEAINSIETGVLNLLNQLEMVDTSVNVKTNSSYQFISKRVSQESKHQGIFYPLKRSGDYVKLGMKIGTITDYFGNTIETIFAETNGVILFMLGTPPINKKDTIVVIGKV